MALNPFRQLFVDFAKGCILTSLLQFHNKKWGVIELIFELLAVHAETKGVLNRLYCYYGNILHHENNHVVHH